METLIFRIPDCKLEDGIRIEGAVDCDGSICHQPIFRNDGTLNSVPPHCHLVTQQPEGEKYHMVLCDFPGLETAPATPVREQKACDSVEAAFAKYLSSALAEYLSSERNR